MADLLFIVITIAFFVLCVATCASATGSSGLTRAAATPVEDDTDDERDIASEVAR